MVEVIKIKFFDYKLSFETPLYKTTYKASPVEVINCEDGDILVRFRVLEKPKARRKRGGVSRMFDFKYKKGKLKKYADDGMYKYSVVPTKCEVKHDFEGDGSICELKITFSVIGKPKFKRKEG